MPSISITQDTVTPHLQRLLREFARPRAILGAGAKAVQKGILAHMASLQARGNKRGWPSQKFFQGKATSVAKNVGVSELTDLTAVVTIADPRFVHRVEGGVVSAKRGKFLAIPLTPAAYAMSGKGSLRESWPGLKFVLTKKGAYLAESSIERRGGRRGKPAAGEITRERLSFQFKLMQAVTHKAHPEEMPDPAKLGVLAREAMLKAAQILMK